ncbi:MAG: family 20 glycosylhydrolase [Flavobacteriales bacterium]|nr:family 20 glycosylhydrolase [Flavobacteriales bacterium]
MTIRKTVFFFVLVTLFSCGGDQNNAISPAYIRDADSLHLIPFPSEVVSKEGYFCWNQSTIIQTEEFPSEGDYLKQLVEGSSDFKVQLNTKIDESDTPKVILESSHPGQEAEFHTLHISENEIRIAAPKAEGIMRGIQTLRQLFMDAFHHKEKRSSWYLPALEITDRPKFRHRGLLLDVCRHFFDKEVVMKYIDMLAFYKMNVLHFHLTEDQGWRMPIDKYPKLNEISSWRIEKDGTKYGGFYSKEDLKEIVAYANERHITIIPEIELPGHAQAALAAYPQYSCSQGPIEVANDWGVFKEIYCAGNDSTFAFLEDILLEVMEIFPSEYIHIGGDEAPKLRWEYCGQCQQRIKEEGLADEHELQSYFIRRIERFLNKHDRKLIGWDEILEGGLSENATVQSWRGIDGGKKAASMGHDVIMSPTSHCYLDYGLDAIDLQKIYSFNPLDKIPLSSQTHILGAECNMWTEHVPDEKDLDSKVFPRMIGLAEVLWSGPGTHDFEDFYGRLDQHFSLLSSYSVQYGRACIGSSIDLNFDEDTIEIILHKELPDLKVKYMWVGKSSKYTNYTSPIPLKNSGQLKIQVFKDNKEYGDPIFQDFVFHDGLNKKVRYFTDYNEWYTGNGKKNLVDGKTGSDNFRDGNWQGFWGQNIDVIIDLGSPTDVSSIKANFYQYANSWIFFPKEVLVQYANTKSTENQYDWTPFGQAFNSRIIMDNTKQKKTFGPESRTSPIKMRYIRFQATSIGKVPAGHDAEGSDSWLFIDEIIIK